jgi:glycerol kinase
VLGRGYREITQHYPAPGWVEHDAHEILDRTIDAAREAMAQAGVVPVAVGITNQRETIVLWDRATGRAVHKAIVWQDRRTAERCAALAPHAAMIAARTGLVTDPYFSATKLA